jgi:hypothetical protein
MGYDGINQDLKTVLTVFFKGSVLLKARKQKNPDFYFPFNNFPVNFGYLFLLLLFLLRKSE